MFSSLNHRRRTRWRRTSLVTAVSVSLDREGCPPHEKLNGRRGAPLYEQLRVDDNRSSCVRGGQKEHGYADHNTDGSFRQDIVSCPEPIVEAATVGPASRHKPRSKFASPAGAEPVDPNAGKDSALAIKLAQTVLLSD